MRCLWGSWLVMLHSFIQSLPRLYWDILYIKTNKYQINYHKLTKTITTLHFDSPGLNSLKKKISLYLSKLKSIICSFSISAEVFSKHKLFIIGSSWEVKLVPEPYEILLGLILGFDAWQTNFFFFFLSQTMTAKEVLHDKKKELEITLISLLPHKVCVWLKVDGTYHTALPYIVCPTKCVNI